MRLQITNESKLQFTKLLSKEVSLNRVLYQHIRLLINGTQLTYPRDRGGKKTSRTQLT
jgi:hypothetical protein